MKKVFAIIAMALIGAATVSAQDIWVNAGYVNATGTYTIGSVSTSEKANGFIAGLEYDYDFSTIASVALGANFAYTNSKYQDGGYNHNETTMGIEIPVLARFGYDFADSFRGFVQAGPNAYIGLSSKDKYSMGSASYTYDNYAEGDYSRFDLGITFGGGIEFQSTYRLFVNYTIGLLNNSKVNNVTYKNNYLTVGLSYRF